MNESNPSKVLLPIEKILRALITTGAGSCYVFSVFDLCRKDATELKNMLEA